MSENMPWFKCNPAEWLQSCADMESEEFGYYARLILFMYQRGGMAPFDEGKLRHIWNCSRQRARKVRDALLEAGRIERFGGQLTQSRVKRELRIAKKIDEKLSKNQTKTNEVFSDKALKTKDTKEQIQDTRYKIPQKPQKELLPASDPVPNVVGVSNAELGDAFARFWSAYPETPNKGGKKVALGWFRTLVVDQRQDPEAVIGAAQRYAASNPEQKFIWSAWKFLRDEHWLNFPARTQVDEPDVWRARIRHFEASGRWADGVGPKPGNLGCQAPAEIQREFGYDPRPLATERRGAA